MTGNKLPDIWLYMNWKTLFRSSRELNETSYCVYGYLQTFLCSILLLQECLHLLDNKHILIYRGLLSWLIRFTSESLPTSLVQRRTTPGLWYHTLAGIPWLLCSKLWWWSGNAPAPLCPVKTQHTWENHICRDQHDHSYATGGAAIEGWVTGKTELISNTYTTILII